MPLPRFDRLDALADPDALATLVGPVAAVTRAPLGTVGYSGSAHELLSVRMRDGETRRFVLKRTRLDRDWTAQRTDDRVGREAALLTEPALAAVWDAFASPYVAVACAEGEVGLLMDDLSAHLFPDVREPIAEAQEERLLGAMAALHARFRESPALERPWLLDADHHCGVLAPSCRGDDAFARVAPAFRDTVCRGWEAALAALPPAVARALARAPDGLSSAWAGLPRTLIHGDVKVANFACLPNGRVAAFDWALCAAAPAAFDVGWYVAVNATRLPHSKEETIERYRALLERALGRRVFEAEWRRTEDAAILVGALMLLWSKALALGSGAVRPRAEWAWWVDRLSAIVVRL